VEWPPVCCTADLCITSVTIRVEWATVDVQEGATLLCLLSSYSGHLCASTLKCSPQNDLAQCWHLNGKKSTSRQCGSEHCFPTDRRRSSRSEVVAMDGIGIE
jgi:hypothetical protein